MSPDLGVRRSSTDALSHGEVDVIRRLLWDAFADDPEEQFDEEDWQHAVGGVHFILDLDGEIVAHASVVDRTLEVDGRPIRTGYVEAVATRPDRQRQGLGTTLMRDVDAYIDEQFELGALGTGTHAFYQRLDWETWRGPSSVRSAEGLQATPDDDGYIMILRTRSSPPLDLDAPISCEWRPGAVW